MAARAALVPACSERGSRPPVGPCDPETERGSACQHGQTFIACRLRSRHDPPRLLSFPLAYSSSLPPVPNTRFFIVPGSYPYKLVEERH
jgi:hypothetical protein